MEPIMDMYEVGRLVDLAIRAVREERLRLAVEQDGRLTLAEAVAAQVALEEARQTA